MRRIFEIAFKKNACQRIQVIIEVERGVEDVDSKVDLRGRSLIEEVAQFVKFLSCDLGLIDGYIVLSSTSAAQYLPRDPRIIKVWCGEMTEPQAHDLLILHGQNDKGARQDRIKAAGMLPVNLLEFSEMMMLEAELAVGNADRDANVSQFLKKLVKNKIISHKDADFAPEVWLARINTVARQNIVIFDPTDLHYKFRSPIDHRAAEKILFSK